MSLITTICLILTLSLLGYESERVKPKPYPLGLGDTLMVRITGYSFCPKYCDADHFHTGHFKNYDCEENTCNHITINEEWFRKTIIICLDVFYGIFCLWDVGRPALYDWSCTCIHTGSNKAH